MDVLEEGGQDNTEGWGGGDDGRGRERKSQGGSRQGLKDQGMSCH